MHCLLIDKLHLLFEQTCNFQPILHHFFLTVLLALELCWQYGITSHTPLLDCTCCKRIKHFHALAKMAFEGYFFLFLDFILTIVENFQVLLADFVGLPLNLMNFVNENNVQAIPILYHIVAQTSFMTRTLWFLLYL